MNDKGLCPKIPAGGVRTRLVISGVSGYHLPMSDHDQSPYLTIPRWNQLSFLVHGFGLAGLSPKSLKSLWPGYALIMPKQIHSDRVKVLEGPLEREWRGDGLATDRPGLLLIIKTADCLPILLADERRRVIAALHCGWRGTVQRLAEKAVGLLHQQYSCEPGELLAAFGPCIGPDCYEVGQDIYDRFFAEGLPLDAFDLHPNRKGKYLLDLQAANRFQLLRAGLDPGNMNFIGDCTHCQPRMSSYRRERDAAGRMLSFIGIKLVTHI